MKVIIINKTTGKGIEYVKEKKKRKKRASRALCA
jgi:uncharacterized protein with GYD domain